VRRLLCSYMYSTYLHVTTYKGKMEVRRGGPQPVRIRGARGSPSPGVATATDTADHRPPPPPPRSTAGQPGGRARAQCKDAVDKGGWGWRTWGTLQNRRGRRPLPAADHRPRTDIGPTIRAAAAMFITGYHPKKKNGGPGWSTGNPSSCPTEFSIWPWGTVTETTCRKLASRLPISNAHFLRGRSRTSDRPTRSTNHVGEGFTEALERSSRDPTGWSTLRETPGRAP